MKHILYGDGIHDDYPALQEMINSGKKELLLPEPEKCYLISKTLELPSNFRLVFPRFAEIKLADGSNCPMCAILVVFLKSLENKNGAEESKPHNPNRMLFVVVMVLSGICIAVNHKLNLYLSGAMDSAVFFPIVNGGGLVLTTLSAVLFFKERLSKKQWLGIFCGIASVVFLCNPF